LLIFILLSKLDGLGRFVAQLHAQAAAGGRDAQVSVPHATHDVEGLACGLLERQSHRVGVHVLLDGSADVRGRLEESVRRHQALDALVWPLEVVGVDVQTQASVAVGVVAEDGPAQKLLPKRLPESLHLAQRLRVLRATLDVTDALATQLLFEVSLSAPCRVLAALVGENFVWRAPRRDRPLERLHHQRRPLMVGHRPAHQEAGVVVHEGCHVQPLVASEQKGEDVRLPELVRSRALEAPRWVLACRRRCGRLGNQTLLVQDATHFRLADAERREAGKHIPDATRPPLGVLLLLGDDRIVSDLRAVTARRVGHRGALLRRQSLLAAKLVP
jgi:hypothetical protein